MSFYTISHRFINLHLSVSDVLLAVIFQRCPHCQFSFGQTPLHKQTTRLTFQLQIYNG